MFGDETLLPGDAAERCIEVTYAGDGDPGPVLLYARGHGRRAAPYLDLSIDMGRPRPAPSAAAAASRRRHASTAARWRTSPPRTRTTPRDGPRGTRPARGEPELPLPGHRAGRPAAIGQDGGVRLHLAHGGRMTSGRATAPAARSAPRLAVSAGGRLHRRAGAATTRPPSRRRPGTPANSVTAAPSFCASPGGTTLSVHRRHHRLPGRTRDGARRYGHPSRGLRDRSQRAAPSSRFPLPTLATHCRSPAATLRLVREPVAGRARSTSTAPRRPDVGRRPRGTRPPAGARRHGGRRAPARRLARVDGDDLVTSSTRGTVQRLPRAGQRRDSGTAAGSSTRASTPRTNRPQLVLTWG